MMPAGGGEGSTSSPDTAGLTRYRGEEDSYEDKERCGEGRTDLVASSWLLRQGFSYPQIGSRGIIWGGDRGGNGEGGGGEGGGGRDGGGGGRGGGGGEGEEGFLPTMVRLTVIPVIPNRQTGSFPSDQCVTLNIFSRDGLSGEQLLLDMPVLLQSYLL